MYEAHFGLEQPPVRRDGQPVGLRRRSQPRRRVAPAALRTRARPGAGRALRSAGLGQDLAGAPAGERAGRSGDPRDLSGPLRRRAGGASSPRSSAVSTVPPASLHAALRQVRGQLAALAARGERPLLIVDDAHLIEAVSTFEALRLLLNFATNGPPDLSLLFVGGAEVLLELPAGLADRLAARCLLGPLTEAESSTYVLGRLAAAGATSPLFSPDALTALHRAADGLPRRLNHLADMALLIAYAQDLPIADDLAVTSALREFGQDVAA